MYIINYMQKSIDNKNVYKKNGVTTLIKSIIN